MGCTSSREARHAGFADGYHHHRHEQPLSRSYSLPFRRLNPWRLHHSPGHHRQHIVSLTSTTLGSLAMDRFPEVDTESYVSSAAEDDHEDAESMKKHLNDSKLANGFSSPLPRGMVWMKAPRTPTMTPPHAQPETINAWEILDGLEDISPICRPQPVVERSRSFHASLPRSKSPKSAIQDLLPPSNSQSPATATSKSPHPAEDSKGGKKPPLPSGRQVGLVRSRIMAFQEKINARRRAKSASCASIHVYVGPPGGEGKVVVYLTSLRGVRRTFEDCSDVLNVLRGYGMRLDERDVSMHAGFKAELADALIVAGGGGGVPAPTGWGLPRVFANGRYLGGADDVRQQHESGKLRKLLDGCQMLPKGGEAAANPGPCEVCGDVRFVPCETCSGSCKVFVETEMDDEEGEDEKEEEEEDDDDEAPAAPVSGEFRRCTDCNENGLVRCPVCSIS